MTHRPSKGKDSRAYDASARRARAQEQLERTLRCARALFLDRGYVGTTVESIARSADVSAATIYKTYGGKAGLLRELCIRALAGEGSVAAEARSDALRAATETQVLVTGWGALAAEVSPRVSPLLLLLRSAADADPEAATLRAELESERLARMTLNARFLADSGHLRTGITVEEARDVLWFCTSPEVYELLMQRRGWSAEQLGSFVAATITGNLL